MKSPIHLLHRSVISGAALAACFSIAMLVSFTEASAANPVPYVVQPLMPDAAAPGGAEFTLTVNGTGFVSASVVRWNSSPRTTHFVSQGELTATIPATDIAKAGTAAITVINPGPGGGTSEAVFFPVAAPTSSVSFTRTDVNASGGNIQVVTADFNGDGKLDLASAEYYAGEVSIFLGNGDGTFTAGATYPACGAHALATGDFNRDGIVDLAAGSDDCPEVTILLGNGNGTFREIGQLAVGQGLPYRLAVGDFNRDGKLDLVTANTSDFVSVLLGNGDGTFQSHVEYNAGPLSHGVTTGDFNGDGLLDLAVATKESVSILLGNGDGTFQPSSAYKLKAITADPCGLGGFFNGTHTPNVISADLNGDGKLDLVVPNNTGFVSVLLGNGNGTFHAGGDYATGGCSVDVTAVDLNEDGTLDLAISNYADSENISVLLGNGDGTFQTHIDYPAIRGARGIVAADFNRDGKLDLAVGNQAGFFGSIDSISVFLQGESFTTAVTVFPSSLNFGSEVVGTSSNPKTVTVTNSGDAAVDISGIVASGSFSQTNNCDSRLLAGANCAIAVTFRPRNTCAKTGTLKITDNASGSPQTVTLGGVGTDVTLSTKSVNFGNQAVGTTSALQTITLTNHSTSRIVPFATVTITGPNVIAFAKSNTCGTGVAPGTSCTISVSFTPHKLGGKAATLNVFDGGGDGPQTVALSGNGT